MPAAYRSPRGESKASAVRTGIAILTAVLVAGPAVGQAPRVPFDPRSDPAFARATPALKRYLARVIPRPRGRQHFCIIGYRVGGERQALVHWREGHALLTWYGRGEAGFPDDTLAFSHHKLDLRRDVVPTDADINSSTYLVSRPWVAQTLADCRRFGMRYTVTPPR